MNHGHYAYPVCQPRTGRTFSVIALLLGATLVALGGSLYAPQAAAKTDSNVARFVEWRNELAKGKHDAWKDYIGDLQGQSLFPYFQYLQLSAELTDLPKEQLLENATHARTRAFLDVWPDIHVSDNLKRRWLRRLGKDQEWELLLKQAVTSPPTDIQCLRLQAKYNTSANQAQQQTALKLAKQLWLRGSSQSKRCDAIFQLLLDGDYITHADYRQRIRNAFKENNAGFARWLNEKLPEPEQGPTAIWFELHKNPAEIAKLFELQPNTLRRELAHKTMYWLAGKDPDQAVALWSEYAAYAKPDTTTQKALWRRLALKATRSFHPQAETWLSRAELKADDSYGWAWRVRAAVQAQNWELIQELSRTPLKLDTQARLGMTYWAAVAAEKLGHTESAQQQFATLARERHWYGYLAADKLNLPYAQPDALPASDSTNRSLLLSYPETRRARDLYLAKSEWLARGEWASLLKKIPKGLRQEAALLAHELEWPSMSARTQAVYTSTKPDETLFPTPWQPLVLSASEEHDVDPAHIWSQMRAESLFMRDVRSGAGAIGLMQLMPATAKQVGRSLKLKNWRRLPLQDPATNIQLGSRYIAEMLEKFDQHIPLAAAAYNAGPHRVEKWLAERPYQDPVLWVEMIPFQETRGYVQRAMYFHSAYDRRLHGKASRVTELLHKNLPTQVAQADTDAEG